MEGSVSEHVHYKPVTDHDKKSVGRLEKGSVADNGLIVKRKTLTPDAGFGTRSSYSKLIIKDVSATSFSEADDGNVPGGCFLCNVGGCFLCNVIVCLDVVRIGLRVEFADDKSALTAVGIFSHRRLGS